MRSCMGFSCMRPPYRFLLWTRLRTRRHSSHSFLCCWSTRPDRRKNRSVFRSRDIGLFLQTRRSPSYLTLQQHGGVGKYLVQLFDAGLEADDVLMTGFDLAQSPTRDPSVRVDLWEENSVTSTTTTELQLAWPTVPTDVHTHIRYEDGEIVTVQHLLQLFVCRHFIHWKRQTDEFQAVVQLL